jgi:hypothetical protein
MRLPFVICVALLGGCGDSEVARLKEVKQAVCDCKTSACAEIALKQVPQTEIKSTPRAQRLARDMLDCLAKLYDAERPTTDPDAIEAEPPAPAAARTP